MVETRPVEPVARWGTGRSAARRATQRAAWTAAILVGALLGVVPLTGQVFLGVDLVRMEIPYLCELQARFALGDSLWLSPVLGHGAPLLADPQFQLFYPVRLFSLLFPPQWGATAAFILQMMIAAAGCAWLIRTFGAGTAAAIGGAVGYAMCGTCMDLLHRSSYVVAAPWLPIVWASARRLRLPRHRGTSFHALTVGMLLLLFGSDPQAFAIGTGIAGVEALGGSAAWRARLVRLAWVTGAASLAVAVALVQWGPTMGELPLTARANMTLGDAMEWSFQPPAWLAAVLPGVLDAPLPGRADFWLLGDLGPLDPRPWNNNPYVGPLALALAAAGLAVRAARIPVLVATTAVLLALGKATPVLPALVAVLPPLGSFRYPVKYLVAGTLALVVAAAVASHHARRRAAAARGLFFAGTAACAVLALAWWWARGHGGTLDAALMSQGLTDPPDLPGTRPPSELIPALLTRAAAPLAAAIALLVGGMRMRAAIPALLAMDLLLGALGTVQFGPPLDVKVTALPAERLRGGGPPIVVCHVDDVASVQFSSGMGDWGRYLPLAALAMPNLNACSRIAVGEWYSVMLPRTTRALQVALTDASAARALGCTHLVANESTEIVGGAVVSSPALLAHVPRVQLRMYELHDPLPEAAAIANPVLHGNEFDLARAIQETTTAVGALALVDDPLGRLPERAVLPAGTRAGAAQLQRLAPHHVVVTVAGEGPAVVAARTPYLVGWRAHQAGHELTVVRVAATQLGAVTPDVSAGPVEFTYTPPGMSAWAALAGVAALAWAGLAWRMRRR